MKPGMKYLESTACAIGIVLLMLVGNVKAQQVPIPQTAVDPEIMKTLRETAFAADKELIAPMMWWRYNGQSAGNGWTTPTNNAAFGTDYYHRTGAVKADPYDNKRNETMYFYTDNDTQLQQLDGKSSYAVTFPKGELPPVKGFWSLTMYDPEHFFYPNALKRYALGTKNKSLKYNDDGGLTIYLGNKSPGKEKDPTGSRHRPETFLSGFVPIGRTGHPRRHLEAAGRQDRKLTSGRLRAANRLTRCH